MSEESSAENLADVVAVKSRRSSEARVIRRRFCSRPSVLVCERRGVPRRRSRDKLRRDEGELKDIAKESSRSYDWKMKEITCGKGTPAETKRAEKGESREEWLKRKGRKGCGLTVEFEPSFYSVSPCVALRTRKQWCK